MKIFIVNKKTFFLTCILILCVAAVLVIGNSGVISVMNEGGEERGASNL